MCLVVFPRPAFDRPLPKKKKIALRVEAIGALHGGPAFPLALIDTYRHSFFFWDFRDPCIGMLLCTPPEVGGNASSIKLNTSY